jgi:hypothetical protein
MNCWFQYSFFFFKEILRNFVQILTSLPKAFLSCLQKTHVVKLHARSKGTSDQKIPYWRSRIERIECKWAKKVLPQLNRENNSILFSYRAYHPLRPPPLRLTLGEVLASSVLAGIAYTTERYWLTAYFVRRITIKKKKKLRFAALQKLTSIL